MCRYNSNKPSSNFVKDYMKNKLWEKSGLEYVPFLNVRSVPTEGKANRVFGLKTTREHHFLSKLEYAAFYYFDWNDEVVDIKEQYPLLPIEILKNIAMEAGIQYPSFAGEPIIMTTDFLVTLNKNGSETQYARTIKPSNKLFDSRIIEKFEIERRYFNSKGIDWGIITEKELSNTFVTNMDMLHSNKLIDSQTISEKQYTFIVYKELVKYIEKEPNKNLPVVYILTQLSTNLNISLSNISEIFFRAILNKVITLDIYNKPLNITELILSDLSINDEIFLKVVNSI